MKFYDQPRIVSLQHRPTVTTEGLIAAITHARAMPIDRTSACMGGYATYTANGTPVNADDPDADIITDITIEVEFARG